MRKALLALVAGAMLAAPAALAQQRGTGLVYLEPERYRSIPLAPPVALTGVPAEFDMSKDFPTPGDQGQQGSCVGWAVGYALKSFQERRERNWTNWDDTKRMSPAFVYNQVKVGGCGDGARIADALGLLSSDGSAAWTDQPYRQEDCDQLPSALTKQNAAMNRIAGWFRVNPQDITIVKANLSAGMPILVGMGLDRNFQELDGDEIWNGSPDASALGHAMVVVGYSDKRQAVKVINSWGTAWGDGGFGWISYDAFMRAVREAYVAQDVVLPVGVAERREHPYVGARGGYGPKFFGVQLGMMGGPAKASLTRPYTSGTTTNNGSTTTTLTVNGNAGDKLKSVQFLVDDRYDYIKQISVYFDDGTTLPEIKAAGPAISRDLVKNAKAHGLFGTSWMVEGGTDIVYRGLPASVPSRKLVEPFIGQSLTDAVTRMNLVDWADILGDDVAPKTASEWFAGGVELHTVASYRADIVKKDLEFTTSLAVNASVVIDRLPASLEIDMLKARDTKECMRVLGAPCTESNLYEPGSRSSLGLHVVALLRSSNTFD